MAENTKIEWATHTFNPWIGCTKVDALCAHCYAETQDNFRHWTPDGWGKGKPRKRTSVANWREPVKWNREAEGRMLRAGLKSAAEIREDFRLGTNYRRPRVFCASLADWLDDEVPVEWLADLLGLIHTTPNLDWLLLTKRPENFRALVRACLFNRPASAFTDWVFNWLNGHPPANVWIGTSVGNQESADARVPELLAIPARVRFLSCEPLLGPLDFSRIAFLHSSWHRPIAGPISPVMPDGIHWVICGGESGPHARPMHPYWARSLRDQCTAAGVPFFFKQWGEWGPTGQLWKNSMLLAPNGKTYPNDDAHPDFKRDYPFRDGHAVLSAMTRKGKAEAGRLLDGREWNDLPR